MEGEKIMVNIMSYEKTIEQAPLRRGIKTKYEYSNGSHMVCIEYDTDVRYVYFPNNGSAFEFLHRIDEYAKLKDLEQLNMLKGGGSSENGGGNG